ncbi:hypothetical protein [Anaerobacillus alkaliphilus]|uniref:hypothetical protein n=1 Tax=Anaerobacillus alkaliphilus TaxID=1548597 RepID=UPI001F4F4DE5|nr:hypothetical protein [Anaerobacillus alkaliphilus]
MKLSNVKKPIAYYYSVVISKFEQESHRDLDEIVSSDEEGTRYLSSTSIFN